jgi:PKD repeat protein
MILLVSSCYREEAVDLEADFEITVSRSDYSVPVEITLTNRSRGADRYEWTFAGGIPSGSTQKQPEKVWYRQAGRYTVRLECWFRDRSASREYVLELDSALHTSFECQIITNAFAPADVQIENRSAGSASYRWTFEGGNPASWEGRQPPLVRYDAPGEYVLRLNTSNGREREETERTVRVLPRMAMDFTPVFPFEDEDRQAPAVVLLESLTTGVLRYQWEAPGGKIDNDTARNTFVYYEHPGSYTITLSTDNDKEIRKQSKTVEILPNTNLCPLQNVRLGVNSATETGAFFSGALRRVLTVAEMEEDESLGKRIDFVFFGLNSRFTYCRFLSPDSAALFTFRPISGAGKTFIVNDLSRTDLAFTLSDFDAMENDAPLIPLDIPSHDTGNLYFDLSVLPRLILFQTQDGRKGAVKIIRSVDAGANSRIEADIKIQKEKR